MGNGAQLSVTDLRRSTRHPVDYPVIAEHRADGDIKMHICNISAHGFMVDSAPAVARGDRLIVRLPVVGRIEAYCIWVADERAGFQFERIIRVDDFMAMIRQLQPNPALRRRS
ncbi:hypothetical protein GCM10009127_20260 [Alteraurantiacibacter aestuarii]|uniref:PilZ domain-containing protein n=1 Tax=Alteraurantiacibacter aestuarii TaxID=650004 RepID=UPI0031DD6068